MPPGGNSPGSAPGDWKCVHCANINFAFREKCNRCNCSAAYPVGGGGLSQEPERRICPFTVMLMRVPHQVSRCVSSTHRARPNC